MQRNMLPEYWLREGGLTLVAHMGAWQMDKRQKREAGVNSQEPECEIGFDSGQIQDKKTLFSVILQQF